MRSVLLGDMIEFSRDGEWGVGEATDGATACRVLRGTDFEAFRGGNVDELPIRFVPMAKVAQKALRSDDIVIETAGGTADRPTGRSVIVRASHLRASDLPICCASFARSVRARVDLIEPGYLYAWLDNAWRIRELSRFNTQHTGVARFQWTRCAESIRVPVPDRPVQEGIARLVGALDDYRANIRQRIDVIDQMVTAVYREWFVHRRHPGFESTESAEDTWRPAVLGDVALVNRMSRRPAADEVISYLDISSLGERTIGQLSVTTGHDAPGRARRVVAPGDVVWSMVRPNRRSHALLVDPASNWIASTGTAVLTPTGISPNFLFELVSSREFSDYLLAQATGAAYPAVKPTDFERAPLLLPPSSLESMFASIAIPMHESIWRLRDEAEHVEAMRDLLLPKLISGQIDVSHIDLDAIEAEVT